MAQNDDNVTSFVTTHRQQGGDYKGVFITKSLQFHNNFDTNNLGQER